MSAWNVWLGTENLYLSYTRNGIISTVAAIALVQYRIVHTDKAPLSGLVFFSLGGYFFTAGTVIYLTQAMQLAGSVSASIFFWPLVVVNGLAPLTLWGLFVLCFTEQTPSWLRRLVLAFDSDLPMDFRNRLNSRTDFRADAPARELAQSRQALKVVRRYDTVVEGQPTPAAASPTEGFRGRRLG